MQLKSLQSFDTPTPNEIRVRAELSAAERDDELLEKAVSLFAVEPKVSAVRWAIQNDRGESAGKESD